MVNTFLPVPDFAHSAWFLDNARLGKQRAECKQILTALRGGRGWRSHPATRMWRGYEGALIRYAVEIVFEWRTRGFSDDTLRWFMSLADEYGFGADPWWLGDDRLHASHRGNLVRKKPEHYGPLWPDADPATPYWWPIECGVWQIGRKGDNPLIHEEVR